MVVSIIVPIYNTEKYLARCLESIRNQEYKNIEVIMIDDGSTDDSNAIAHDFAISDKRFLLISQKNSGVSVARNKGLKKATGEYLLFVDSDDWIEPDMISTLVDNSLASGADISCCQYDKSVRSDIGALEKWEWRQALETFVIHQKINGSLVNKLIKRDILDCLEFDSSIRYGEDALFCWKALLKVKSICITNRVLYHVVLHNDSASGAGSYKAIRKDCITVWNIISEEAEKIDENLGNAVKAQLANMAFYSLYEMMYYKYKNAEDRRLFKTVLSKNYDYQKQAYFISSYEKYLAWMMIKSDKIARIIVLLYSFVKKLVLSVRDS